MRTNDLVNNSLLKFDEIETVLWDWNGTLLDDLEVNWKVINGMLSRRGLKQIDIVAYKNAFCFPVKLFYERVGIDLMKEPFDEAAEEYMTNYRSYEKEISLNPDASLVLETIYRKGISQYILFACPQNELMQTLDRFCLTSRFRKIYGAEDIRANGKIETGRLLIQNHSINPKRTLLIGDTIHDAEVAKAIGVNYILYSGGHNSYDLLSKESKVITDLREVLAL